MLVKLRFLGICGKQVSVQISRVKNYSYALKNCMKSFCLDLKTDGNLTVYQHFY